MFHTAADKLTRGSSSDVDESTTVTTTLKTWLHHDTYVSYPTGSKIATQRLKSAGVLHSNISSKLQQSSVNSSKSVFVPTSRLNLPPANKSSLIRSPQPLTVMGYRSDILNTQQKQNSSTNKHKTMEKSSSNSLKTSPTRTVSLRWKIRPATNPRANQYSDPLFNADTVYMNRISEMASLEAETIKYEKGRKFKRK